MLQPGDVVGGYRIDAVLGQGGMGVVYRATQLSLNRTVALKFLSAHFVQDVDFRERFRREGVIQAAIDHPHIVPVYEAGEVREGLFLAMRLVRGPNLKELIVAGELDAARALTILRQIADALDEAHSAGLTHRDIKPQNILVGERDHGYLADFGLTKGGDVSSLTRTGQFLGTIDYVAPEQINGEFATSRSDIYSLTSVLYECLTGSVPYKRPSEAAVLFAHVTDPPPRVSERRPDLPMQIDGVIARGMAKRPEDRHDSAVALLDDAVAALGQEGSTASAPAIRARSSRAPTTIPKAGHPPAGVTTEPEVATAPAAIVSGATTEPEVAPAAGATTEPEAPPVAGATTEPEVAPQAASLSGATTEPEVAADTTEPSVVAEPAPREEAATVPIDEPEPEPEPEPRERTAATVPDLRPAPADDRSRRERSDALRRRRAAVLATALLATAGGAVVGMLVGGSGAPAQEAAQAQPSTVEADGFALTHPAGWRRGDPDPDALGGVEFERPIALVPAGEPPDRELIAGTVQSGHPSLLPASLRENLAQPPGRPDAVRLGDAQAYRYAELRLKGLDRVASVLALPTTAGVATVACLAPPAAAAAFSAACEQVAATLELSGARALPLGPDAAFARRLDAVMNTLNRRRGAERKALRAASSPRRQATYAGRLADAFRTAARDTARSPASPAVQDSRAAIAAAMRTTADRYGALAAAARANRRPAYNRARRQVTGAEQQLRRALARLEQEGYRVG